MGEKSPFKEDGMFGGAHPLLFKRAKELRKNMTDAEQLLWRHLRLGINGHKFRRQHPISIYIADFYCHKFKLIIELDGSIHNNDEVQEYDKAREKDLQDWGYKILRFTNNEVKLDVEEIVKRIECLLLNNS